MLLDDIERVVGVGFPLKGYGGGEYSKFVHRFAEWQPDGKAGQAYACWMACFIVCLTSGMPPWAMKHCAASHKRSLAWDCTQVWMAAFGRCFTAVNARTSSDEALVQLEANIRQLQTVIEHPAVSQFYKPGLSMHMLFTHVVPQMRLYGTTVHFATQATEHLNHRMNGDVTHNSTRRGASRERDVLVRESVTGSPELRERSDFDRTLHSSKPAVPATVTAAAPLTPACALLPARLAAATALKVAPPAGGALVQPSALTVVQLESAPG